VGSNPNGAVDVCLLRVLCVVRYRPCDELITRPEESYRLWCVVVCDLETLKNEEAMTRVGSQRHRKVYIYIYIYIYIYAVTIVLQRVNEVLLSPRHYHTPITGYHSLLHLSDNRKILGSYPDCRPGVLKFVIS
jgi:hypothetical protein